MTHAPIVRRSKLNKKEWRANDIAVCKQLFKYGMVSNIDLESQKTAKYLIRHDYVIVSKGMNALTGKGTAAFLKFLYYDLKDPFYNTIMMFVYMDKHLTEKV